MRNWHKLVIVLSVVLVAQILYLHYYQLTTHDDVSFSSHQTHTDLQLANAINGSEDFVDFVYGLSKRFPQFPTDFDWSLIPSEGCSKIDLKSPFGVSSIARKSKMFNLHEQTGFSVNSHPGFVHMMPFYQCNYTEWSKDGQRRQELCGNGFILPLRNSLVYSTHPEILDCNSQSLFRPFGCRQHIDLPNRLSLSRPKNVTRLEGEVVVATGFFGTYYHFVVEELPRLAMVHSYLLQNPQVRVLINIEPFAERFVKMFGLDFSRFVGTKSNTLYSIEKAIVPMGIRCGFPNPGMMQYTREILLWRYKEVQEKVNKDHGSSSKVIILHKRKGQRQISNHAELLAQLQISFPDYKVIESFHNDTLEQNVEKHMMADFVIGPHGANMVNMLFCKPGVKIIEIHPHHGNTEDEINFVYVRMAKALGLQLNWTKSKSGSYSSSFKADVADVVQLVSKTII